MPEMPHLEVPHGRLPDYLAGLKLPVTVEEALEYAETHGAPPEALEFLESLPGAVFTTETGLRHAFSALHAGQIPHTHPEQTHIAHDGTTS